MSRCRREQNVARRQAPARPQERLVFCEVLCPGANVGPARNRLADRNRRACRDDVFLNDNGIAAFWHRGAREDARCLTFPELALKRPPGPRLADEFNRCRDRRDIVGADRIAVHCGSVERRVIETRRDRVRERPAKSVTEIDVFRCERRGILEDAPKRFGDGEQSHGLSRLWRSCGL